MSRPSLHDLTIRLAATKPEMADRLLPFLGLNDLQGRLVRLAAEHPKLRDNLLRRLKAAGNTSVVQQPPIVIQQPPVIVQQEAPAPAPAPVPMVMQVPMAPVMPAMPAAPVAPGIPTPPAMPSYESPNSTTTQVPEAGGGPPAFGAMFVTERTQRGFEADLLPEMNRLVESGWARQDVADHMSQLIRQAFAAKNHLYNILIRHQATFEGDGEYRESLERLIGTWARDTAREVTPSNGV